MCVEELQVALLSASRLYNTSAPGRCVERSFCSWLCAAAAAAVCTSVAQLMLATSCAPLLVRGMECRSHCVQPWQWACGRLVAAVCAWLYARPL
jgi:hypothetical protein